jgi:tetratricopeptide (TPR) repeat protein
MQKFIILTITAILFFSCSTDKKKAIEHYIKAKESLKNDNIKNASSEIDLAIKLDSSNLDFQILKAKIIKKTGNYDLAIRILKGLSTRNFKLDTVNFNIGSCYLSYGSHFITKLKDQEKSKICYKKAHDYFNKAINLNTQYFNAYVGKQQVLHNLDRHDEALVFLTSAIKLFPDSTSLICYRGIEKMFLGDLTGAITDLNKTILSNKLDSLDFSTAYRFRGMLYLEKGETDEAINDLTSALKYNPNNERALFTRAICYKAMGLKDKACEDYRKAAELGFVILYETIKEYCVDKVEYKP